MLLYQLTVSRFRNIDRIEMDVHQRFTVLHGDNAQGKTNLLEAIHLLGSLKSFRGARNDELIRKGDEQAIISGHCRQQNQVERLLQVEIRRDGKTVRLDNKGVNKPGDYLSSLRSIIFAPEEVGLVKGGPHGRRRLVDRAVFMTRPSYLTELQEYERLLKQRNRLLKNSGTQAELLPWTEALARSGATIRKERSIYLQAIANGLAQCHHRISQQREAASIRYRQQEVDQQELEKELLKELEQQREQERRYGMTLSGPHRDDVHFLLDGRPLRTFGSQGQQRSFILALKTAQALDIEQRFSEPPLLLFDDLLGELDENRQKFFFTFLAERRGQVFITTTDASVLRNGGLTEGNYYRMENGTLHPEG